MRKLNLETRRARLPALRLRVPRSPASALLFLLGYSGATVLQVLCRFHCSRVSVCSKCSLQERPAILALLFTNNATDKETATMVTVVFMKLQYPNISYLPVLTTNYLRRTRSELCSRTEESSNSLSARTSIKRGTRSSRAIPVYSR